MPAPVGRSIRDCSHVLTVAELTNRQVTPSTYNPIFCLDGSA